MKESFRLKETFAWITADEKRYIEIAKEEIKQRRKELERFVRWHPYFLVTLESYRIEERDKATEKRVHYRTHHRCRDGIILACCVT